MTPADIRRQVVLEEHDLSRDGSARGRRRRSIRRDRYVTPPLRRAARLGGAPARRPRRLDRPAPVRDGWPRLSPDGRRVAFIRGYPSTTTSPRSPSACVSIDGGRVRELRRGDHGSIGELAWSPDGRRLAFTAEVDPPRFLVGDVPPLGAQGAAQPTADDAPPARRITRTDWRWDGSGHLDRWSHLFVVDAAPGRAAAPGHRAATGA